MSFHHYAVLMLLFVSSWTTTVSLSGRYLSIVSLEKRYKYRFILSQILIQDTALIMMQDTRYIFRILDTYLDTSILITIQHWAYARYHFCNALFSISAKNNIVLDFGPVVSTVSL